MNQQEQRTQDRMISWPIVSEISGYKSKNTIKTKEDRGEFPKRIYLSSNCIRWWESEVLEWAKKLPRTLEACQQRHDGNQEAA